MRLSPFFLGALLAVAGRAGASTMTYPGSTTTLHETASDFASAELSQLQLDGAAIRLLPGQQIGTLTSAPLTVPAFDELVPSWNSHTGQAGSAELEVRVQLAGPANAAWSRWYSFGRWSAADGRSSQKGQKDAQGQVLTDTLRLNQKATTLQYRLTLRGADTSVRLIGLNTSLRSERAAGLGQISDRQGWGKINSVPQRSQMIYPGGGEVWCSPTSVSMILAKYGIDHTVPDTARATYDQAYEGTGNWPFNTAYASEQGMRAFVTRLPSLAAAEKYTAAGVPLGVSLGWKKGELPGAALPQSDGHLMVLLGFDQAGNPVLNDPAAPTNSGVRRTYPRAAFEKLWLTHSGGLSYVIAPQGSALP